MSISYQKRVGIRDKGVKIYQFDAETKEYIGMYDSISECADDHGLIKEYVAMRTRKNPNGVKIKGLYFSRVAPTGVKLV